MARIEERMGEVEGMGMKTGRCRGAEFVAGVGEVQVRMWKSLS